MQAHVFHVLQQMNPLDPPPTPFDRLKTIPIACGEDRAKRRSRRKLEDDHKEERGRVAPIGRDIDITLVVT